MKRFSCLFFCFGTLTIAVASFIKDYNGEKILKGIISRDILASDSTFKWYAQNLKSYPVGTEATSTFGKHKDSVQLVIFLGTWCEDSHNVPTVIVMKEGKELDRVVEYGRYGMVENELAEIVDKK